MKYELACGRHTYWVLVKQTTIGVFNVQAKYGYQLCERYVAPQCW